MVKKLSVIIPMYNVSQYIEKCLGSVYDQGLNEEDFEIILVDDESPDNSLIIAEKFTQGKKNVKIISQKNKGLGGARNTGMHNAQGEFLLFLDSDDWLVPNMLKKILRIADENQLDILEFAAQGVTPDGKIAYHKFMSSNKILDGINYYNSVRYMNSVCNKLYKNDFLISNKLFFLEQIFIEDFEFNTRVFTQAKRVLATDLLVAQFLQSINSITRNCSILKKDKMVHDIIIVLQKTKETYQNYQSTCDFQTHSYFKERMGFIVVTLFFQLFKNKVPFAEIKKVKLKLVEQELFYVNDIILQKDKNLFRKIMLKNFWLFQFTQPILKYL